MPATVCVCVRVCPRLLLLLLMKSVVQPRRRCLLLLLLLRLLLATSVTAHLTHLARPAIGTKMFSSHGNNVVQASHEWGGGRGYRGVAAKNKNWYKFFTHTFHAFHTPLAGWQQIEMFISKCLLRIYEQSPLCQVRPLLPLPKWSAAPQISLALLS